MNTYTIKSHTNPNKTYTVTFPDTGPASCTCVGYGYRRTCSHIIEALQQLEQELRQLLSQHEQSFMYFCTSCGVQLTGTHTFTGKCPACTRKETFHHAAA